MLRRVIARYLGVSGHAQTLSRGSFQLVLRDGKFATSFPCINPSTQLSSCQIRSLSDTRSYAAAEEAIVEEAPVEILVTPKKRTGAKKPAAAKATSTKTGRKPRSTSKTSETAKKSTSKPGRPKKKAAPKKKKPTAKKKPAAKKKLTPKKRVAKKPPTPFQAYSAKIKALREQALLTVPKLLPRNGYMVYSVEHQVTGQSSAASAKVISANYKALSLSEREHYDNMANQNKIANEKTILTWTESHTPDEIRLANVARRQINKIVKAPVIEGRRSRGVSHVNLIKDARAVSLGNSAYLAYARDRWLSGDFKGQRASVVAKVMGADWKVLDNSEKQKYIDASRENKALLREQYNAIFTRGRKSPPKSAIKPIEG